MKEASPWVRDVVASPWESFFGLHDHLRGDIEALFEHQRQDQGDHCKDQEDPLHQLFLLAKKILKNSCR